ncbi:rhodanese-like domain-containing protein [Alicyclobacillus kakegawensis]|uniref:rhodanese-like domain-containing protein n=1 Tax=Alicyclobacillus kakegawensis TaxID=392012 RepID=UPI000833C2E7|nr:rhodanese-like domain-containing protein [Alicyclobacillus kakegawensis]
MAFDHNGIPQYSPQEVRTILSQRTVQVIDVRTPEEYESGHIPGVPLHPMQEVTDWMEQLDPADEYIFVCRSGNRSQRVAEFLKANGFSRVGNLAGGMLQWDGEVISGSDL